MIPDDLRLRLVGALLLVLAISQLRHLGPALGGLAAVLTLVLVCRPDPRLWRRLRHVEGFVLLLLVTMPFTLPGAPLLTLGPFSASREGVARSLLVAAKVTASAVVLLGFLATTEPVRLGAALHALRVPEPLVRLLLLTLRYLQLIRDEARRLLEAMRVRGFRAGSNQHTWRSYVNLVGMLLVRALSRAQRIDEAMRCGGFTGRFPYPALPRPVRSDWIVLTGLLAACILVTAADRAWAC